MLYAAGGCQLLSALSSAHASVSAFVAQHNLTSDHVDSVQESWRDVLEQQQDVSAALTQPLSSTVDDDEVEAEYQRMLENEAVSWRTKQPVERQQAATAVEDEDTRKRESAAIVISL